MKYLTIDGRFWVRQEDNGQVSVGLTKEYLNRLGPFWNYLIKEPIGKVVKVDQQLVAVEAFCSNVAIRSPIEGVLTYVNLNPAEHPAMEMDDSTTLFVFKDVPSLEHLVGA